MRPIRVCLFQIPVCRVALLIAWCALAYPAVSSAQLSPFGCPSGRQQISGYFENDLSKLALGLGTDEAYTNGVRFEVSRAVGDSQSGPFGTLFPLRRKPGTCFRYTFALAHLLYTPKNIETEELQANDRPYGGWLYLSYELTRSDFSVDPSRVDLFGVDVGLLGPGAGGEIVQDTVHNLFNIPSRVGQSYKKPLGWHHQLRNEPTFNVRLLRQQRVVTDDVTNGAERNWDAIAAYGGAAGNVFTWAQGGVKGRLGINLPNDLGTKTIPAPPPMAPQESSAALVAPAAARPVVPAPPPPPQRRWYLYGFIGTEGRAVLRNAFLDGNLFTANRPDMGHVEKRPLVADFDWGGVFAWHFFRVAYHNVLRSPEFRTPPGMPDGRANNHAHRFGSLAVTLGGLF